MEKQFFTNTYGGMQANSVKAAAAAARTKEGLVMTSGQSSGKIQTSIINPALVS